LINNNHSIEFAVLIGKYICSSDIKNVDYFSIRKCNSNKYKILCKKRGRYEIFCCNAYQPNTRNNSKRECFYIKFTI